MDVVSIRPSSWAALFDCAHRWEGIHLLGLRSPPGGRLHLGTSLHAGTAAFDQSRIDRSGATVDDAAGVFVDTLQCPDEDVVWDDISPREAERIGLPLIVRYCEDVSPRYEFVAVEQRLEALDIEVPEQDVTIRVQGTMDRARIRLGADGIGVSDIKSGQRAVKGDGTAETKGHWIQLGLYELGAEHAQGMPVTLPAEIVGLHTAGKPKVGVGEIRNARRGLIGTDEQPGLIDMAAAMFRSGLFPPNPKSLTCGPKYCPRWSTCRFHD